MTIKKNHGLKKHRLYNTWNNMLQRCNNQNHLLYKYYGNRDIKVCNRWLDIRNFIEDMFPSYKEGLSLDRIDNNGNYEQSNCRWTTKTIQSRNTRKIYKHNSSGYRGVMWDKSRNKWIARIKVNSKSKQLGSFNSALEGAIAYDKYVIENNLEHTLKFNNKGVTSKSNLYLIDKVIETEKGLK